VIAISDNVLNVYKTLSDAKGLIVVEGTSAVV
jgi:hypothetical protein